MCICVCFLESKGGRKKGKKKKKNGIKTSEVDRLVSKRLRNERRSNLHTLFLCF
jgi:hypothetical protein